MMISLRQLRIILASLFFAFGVCGAGHVLAGHSLVLTIIDADTEKPLAARVYLTAKDGTPFFFESAEEAGTAIKYEKKNWNNKNSIEYHTTVSAHSCYVTLEPGSYSLTIERGKTYFPVQASIEMADKDLELTLKLKQWSDPAKRDWYSGDTHIHRTVDDLRNIILAEDLNVVFPLTSWVTNSDTPPSSGDKSMTGDIPEKLVEVDKTHVIWPRNTEYEIFRVGEQRHTLGALFVLGHEGTLEKTVPPWRPIIESARGDNSDVLFDMDKLDWPFAMVLPVLAPDSLYELSNNHLWRTEFGFEKWNTTAPAYLQPPYGTQQGGERQWLDYTLGMYSTLLNCGFRLPPSAGTANGVHPVPAGFGRVYVHLKDGFNHKAWIKGLQAGRSFVTTGPMLFATADEHDPGHEFQWKTTNGDALEIPLEMEIISETPLSYGEIVINGSPDHLLRPQNMKTPEGAFRSVINQKIRLTESGWFTVRFFEERDDARIRFAHTAPWYVVVDDQPVHLREEEQRYLVSRMEEEIKRSEGIVSAEGMAEYREALDYYQSLPTRDDTESVQQTARELSAENRDRWLNNMIVAHRFTPEEVRAATGLSLTEAEAVVQEYQSRRKDFEETSPTIQVMPYPGGRHPRKGFFDGAIHPQRETKVSIFPPWENGGYVVVDVPEAIFSNLGLTYLAHTHIPTIWSAAGNELPPLEWHKKEGTLVSERTLPNGIKFSSSVAAGESSVDMQMSLTNGTSQLLTGLRSQVCVMLKGAPGFNNQQTLLTVVNEPFIAVRSETENRWMITAWTPCHRALANPPVPCVHSDPIFPDCPPGETVHVRGKMWFYKGENIDQELVRLTKTFVTDTGKL